MTKQWWRAAGIRAIKTAAQTAVALIGTGAVGFTDLDWARIASVAGVAMIPVAVTVAEVDWLTVGSTMLVAGVLSLLTSVAGLPELDAQPDDSEM